MAGAVQGETVLLFIYFCSEGQFRSVKSATAASPEPLAVIL